MIWFDFYCIVIMPRRNSHSRKGRDQQDESESSSSCSSDSEWTDTIDNSSNEEDDDASESTESSQPSESEYNSYSTTDDKQEERDSNRKRANKRKHGSSSKSKRNDVETDDEEETFDSTELNQLLYDLFPSKFTKEKVDAAIENSKHETKKSKNKNGKLGKKDKRDKTLSEPRKGKRVKNDKYKQKKSSKRRKKYDSNDDDDDDAMVRKKSKARKYRDDDDDTNSCLSDGENDDDDSFTSDDESSMTLDTDNGRNHEDEINIILAPYGTTDLFGEEDEDTKIQRALHNNNEEFDSDDEKTFMKEAYTDVPDPANTLTKKEKRLKEKRAVKRAKQEERKKAILKDIDAEYRDLIELKKHIAQKLAEKPHSRILVNSYQNCKQSIKKLMKKTRTKNTRQYFKLLKDQVKSENEIDYFKKKLSNKEQLQILKEMQDINTHLNIEKPHRLMLMQSTIPMKYKATIMNKLNTMFSMEQGDTEYFKMKNWVDTFMRIPFGIYRNLPVTIGDGKDACASYMKQAKATLDECVYGMDDAKLQVMQLVGNWISNPSAMGTSIAICGPPGTGKTQLVRDGISKILGREFAFIPLGGAGDASFLEGHGYTYEGSQWGRIVQILLDAKSMNPVIFFDEVDKVAPEGRGREIINILIHLTDATQNSQFHDKYFSEIDFDLSKALFIFSLNDETLLDPILRDRMYRIKTRGYEVKEKLTIARKYIIPKILEQVKFEPTDIDIPDDTLTYLVTDDRFAKSESGVRHLKRCLEIIYSKLNLFRLLDDNVNVTDILGKNVDLKVVFPYTVTRRAVDVLIKNDEQKNPSFLAMYL